MVVQAAPAVVAVSLVTSCTLSGILGLMADHSSSKGVCRLTACSKGSSRCHSRGSSRGSTLQRSMDTSHGAARWLSANNECLPGHAGKDTAGRGK